MIRKQVEKLRGLVFTPEELKEVIFPAIVSSKEKEEKSAVNTFDSWKFFPDYDLGLYDTIITMGHKLSGRKAEIDKAFKSDGTYYVCFGRSVRLDDLINATKEAFLCAGCNPARYNFELEYYTGAPLVRITRK